MDTPCRRRTFPLRLRPLSRGLLVKYTAWLNHLAERLGSSEAFALWESALNRYELTPLESILKSGWTPVEDAEAHTEDQGSPDRRDAPSTAATDTLYAQAPPAVQRAPPIAQLRSSFANPSLQRETTAYEALHLVMHGPALLAEALLDRFGKQGEFIAYEILTERRCAGLPGGGVAISEFMRRHDYGPGTRNIFTAGLDVDNVEVSDTEHAFMVRHCEWARYFREKHPRVGYLMACSTDEAFARASNPAIRLQRTSTLMEGGEVCDFRYYAVEEGSQS